MRSDRPERATHNILEDARVAVGQWKIQVLAKPARLPKYTTPVYQEDEALRRNDCEHDRM